MSDTLTLAEWQEQGRELFGDDWHDWSFVCPHCGDVYTGLDMLEANDGDEDQATRRLGRECIGRSLGALDKRIPRGKYAGRGCDWCAYGLFRGPVIIRMPQGGDAGAFRFAVAQEAAGDESGDARPIDRRDFRPEV